MNDAEYMRLALALAEQGRGWTAPNPMVGAVIVKDGAVIGQGWHERYGEPHAERNALASCTADPAGATMYVTLEPCCHHGKQPPCVDAILASGIRRVVIGSADPNPLVAGKGVAILRSHGVEVTKNVLRQECDALNKIFFHYITTGRPFVSMKYAMTMDGKIAAYTGASKWVTGETARRHVQQQRHRFRGIMVGVGTVLADDPLLTCRMENGRNPVRIICDTHLRTPPQAQVVTTADQIPTILATCCTDPERQAVYRMAGCQVLCLNEENGHVDLRQLMERLGREQIDSILLECLSGMPFDVEFISFDDVRDGIPEDIGVIINVGDAYTAFSGAENWIDEKVVTAIRRFVDQGGGFIGVGEPTAYQHQGRYFQLSDVLGVDREMEFSLSTDKYNEMDPHHFILEDIDGDIDFGEGTSRIYAQGRHYQILAQDGEYSELVVNEYGKGHSVYFAGLPYSPQNCRILLRAIYYAAGMEEEMKHYYVTNVDTEVTVFPETKRIAVINNADKPCHTDVYIKGKLIYEVDLEPRELRWLDDVEE